MTYIQRFMMRGSNTYRLIYLYFYKSIYTNTNCCKSAGKMFFFICTRFLFPKENIAMLVFTK